MKGQSGDAVGAAGFEGDRDVQRLAGVCLPRVFGSVAEIAFAGRAEMTEPRFL